MVEFTSALCEPTDTSHATCRAPPPPTDVRRKMRQLGKMLLLLALAGCVSSDFYQDEPIKPEPSINQSAIGPAPQSVQHNLSPAATAAASKSDETDSGGALKDCVTESCKINCSPKVKKQFRPKWCVNFKEPAVE